LLEFKHPFIICFHKLKLSNLEQLGRALAEKLNSTIQIENNEGFKITDESSNFTYCSQLKIASTTIIPQLKYEIRLGDFKLFLFEDFIEIKINFEVDYFHLLDLHKRNGLKKFEFFKEFFKILNTMGVTYIYFGVFDEFGNGKKVNYKWRNVLKEVSNTTHFKLSLF
jgi:hypothetical protein